MNDALNFSIDGDDRGYKYKKAKAIINSNTMEIWYPQNWKYVPYSPDGYSGGSSAESGQERNLWRCKRGGAHQKERCWSLISRCRSKSFAFLLQIQQAGDSGQRV